MAMHSVHRRHITVCTPAEIGAQGGVAQGGGGRGYIMGAGISLVHESEIDFENILQIKQFLVHKIYLYKKVYIPENIQKTKIYQIYTQDGFFTVHWSHVLLEIAIFFKDNHLYKNIMIFLYGLCVEGCALEYAETYFMVNISEVCCITFRLLLHFSSQPSSNCSHFHGWLLGEPHSIKHLVAFGASALSLPITQQAET